MRSIRNRIDYTLFSPDMLALHHAETRKGFRPSELARRAHESSRAHRYCAENNQFWARLLSAFHIARTALPAAN